MQDVFIPNVSEEVFNFSGVLNEKVLAWEIDKEILEISQSFSDVLKGSNILSPQVGNLLREKANKMFSPKDVLNVSEEIYAQAEQTLRFQKVFTKWQKLSRANEKMIEVGGKMVRESLVM